MKNENDEKKIDEDNNHFECKDSQNNSEDGKEELELSEMIVCDEVACDSDDVCLSLTFDIFNYFIMYSFILIVYKYLFVCRMIIKWKLKLLSKINMKETLKKQKKNQKIKKVLRRDMIKNQVNIFLLNNIWSSLKY